ncbi:MAG: hypothetical protein HYU64_15465 [Armatimonadetes bacterium]|nr:hypothetical protein [Armatimonadota bacterium]
MTSDKQRYTFQGQCDEPGIVETVELWPDSADESSDGEKECRIVFALSKTGLNTETSIEFDPSSVHGDSFLKTNEQVSVKGSDRPGSFECEFTFLRNKDNSIRAVSTRIKAKSLWEAEAFAYSLIAPVLSYMAFKFGVPVNIVQIVSHAVLPGGGVARRVTYQTPHFSQNFRASDIGEFQTLPRLRPLFAAYREGLTSNNLYYKLLSFCKIIETVMKKVRPANAQLAQRNGLADAYPKERVERSKFTEEEFPDLIGKKFTTVYDEVLKDKCRNAVAHISLDDNWLPEQSQDLYDSFVTVSKFVRLAKMMARTMLQNEMAVLTRLNARARSEPTSDGGSEPCSNMNPQQEEDEQ